MSFDLAACLRQLEQLERETDTWPDAHSQTYRQLREESEALQREAWRRLLQALQPQPEFRERLQALASDPVVYAVLRRFELLKPSLDERIARALEPVRPLLHAHGGDVEIVEIRLPDTVLVRMTGACDGCPASAITLTAGVVRAIRQACPEIRTVRDVSAGALSDMPADTRSPFASKT